MAPLCYAAKLDPFLSLDCAPTPSSLAQSKERKGSNFAIWQPLRTVHPPYLAGSLRVLRSRRRVQQIQRNLEDLARGRCLCSGRSERPNQQPALLRPSHPERYLLLAARRSAGLERGGLCNGLRPSVGTHSGFRSSSSSSSSNMYRTLTQTLPLSVGPPWPGTAKKRRPSRRRPRPRSPTAATSGGPVRAPAVSLAPVGGDPTHSLTPTKKLQRRRQDGRTDGQGEGGEERESWTTDASARPFNGSGARAR